MTARKYAPNQLTFHVSYKKLGLTNSSPVDLVIELSTMVYIVLYNVVASIQILMVSIIISVVFIINRPSPQVYMVMIII